jgi:hypothetical protein
VRAKSKKHLLVPVPNAAECCALEAAPRNSALRDSNLSCGVRYCHTRHVLSPSNQVSATAHPCTLSQSWLLTMAQSSEGCSYSMLPSCTTATALFSYLCKSYLPYGSEGLWLRYSPPELSTRILWAKTQQTYQLQERGYQRDDVTVPMAVH